MKYFLIFIIYACTLIMPIFAMAQSNATVVENKPISLNFNDIAVRDVLQLLAQIQGANLIISDSVKGNITLHLENISWQQALNIILQEQGLGQERIGNVIMIASLNELAARQTQQLQVEQEMQNAAPLQSTLINLRYSKAQDVANTLKSQTANFLSARGNVSVDPRTNSLWIEDSPDKINQVRNYISQIDIPVKQVVIEARIVNVDSKFEQELGVRFGLTRPNNNLSGTLSGANALAGNTAPQAITNPLDRLNVDLPATNAGTANGAASLGIALATLGNSNLLDLELSALETEGGGEIISSPRLITANQQPASILSGQEIPYQQSTSSGATNVSFQKAVLSLTVTPQITPGNKLILNLQVNQDRPSTTLIQGVPSIETRQIQTQVLVDNGQTIVLGGIYEQSDQNQVERVPFLGTLPLIGGLFRHTSVNKDRRELLIFITPTVMQS